MTGRRFRPTTTKVTRSRECAAAVRLLDVGVVLRGQTGRHRAAAAGDAAERAADQRPRSRKNIKLRLIAEGIKDDLCEECGISEWRDEPLSLELHHRNGEKHDNRLENLALLCPNCHSQTHTWGGKNVLARGRGSRPGSTPPPAARRTLPRAVEARTLQPGANRGEFFAKPASRLSDLRPLYLAACDARPRSGPHGRHRA